jgi:hypothetical protein
LTAQVADSIHPQVTNVKQEFNDLDDDDDDIGELFADDYCGEATSISNANVLGPLETLFVLLQDTAAPTITVSFLEDLFSQYNHNMEKENEGSDQLERILLMYSLKRIGEAKKSSSSFSISRLSHGVTALSTLLLAPSVGRALASMMSSEISQMTGKNGYEVQKITALAPLLETVAYCIPTAGVERQDQNSSRGGPFLQQLSQIRDFPLSTFRVKDNHEVGQVMTDSRRTMKMTCSTACQLLRIAFKTGGKEQTFQWLVQVIRSK